MSEPGPTPSPVDPARRIGTVTVATAQWVTINLPNAGTDAPFIHHGDVVPRGEVGEYVCFPKGNTVVVGRITRVELPERDRLSLEPKIGRPEAVDPIGHVALLTDVDLREGDVSGAVSAPPRLGTAAFSVSSIFLQWVLESSARKRGEGTSITLCVGDVAGATKTPVTVSPERLFGRHCAVLGVTGGGKSWTIARLIEECARHDAKVVLIDATGEFSTLKEFVDHGSIGSEKDAPASSVELSCPYHLLEERDLFALFTPSGQSQAPMLREAIRSLKLAKCAGLPAGYVVNGCIPKTGKKKVDFIKHCQANIATIESPLADFSIEQLSAQIQHECVYPSGNFGKDDTTWGDIDARAVGYCMTLLMRIDSMSKDDAFTPIFRPRSLKPVQKALDEFLASTTKRVLRISLRFMSFAQSARPIVVNAIGRHLLQVARTGRFKTKPTLVVLDEAHQFLGKCVGDESNSQELDAFDLIAKEGRKYGLTVCLATQRPRDIQDGVLSQMGTMIVHRLTHGADREVVERAARDVEKSVATFLPTLAPGQAILLGADFPVPIPIQIREPTMRPESKGPDYQRHWAAASGPSGAASVSTAPAPAVSPAAGASRKSAGRPK
jgi:hypothetical protein